MRLAFPRTQMLHGELCSAFAIFPVSFSPGFVFNRPKTPTFQNDFLTLVIPRLLTDKYVYSEGFIIWYTYWRSSQLTSHNLGLALQYPRREQWPRRYTFRGGAHAVAESPRGGELLRKELPTFTNIDNIVFVVTSRINRNSCFSKSPKCACPCIYPKSMPSTIFNQSHLMKHCFSGSALSNERSSSTSLFWATSQQTWKNKSSTPPSPFYCGVVHTENFRGNLGIDW